VSEGAGTVRTVLRFAARSERCVILDSTQLTISRRDAALAQTSCLRGAAEENNYYQEIQPFISTLEADIIVLF